jgi:Cation efflux family
VGLALAAVSLAVMPGLSYAQRRAGRELGSRTAVADSKQTLLCTYLSAVLLVGLAANSFLGWWWADPLTALVIAAVAVKEGRGAWRGDEMAALPGSTCHKGRKENMDTPRRTRTYRSHHLDSERWDHVTLRPGDIVISTSMKAGTTWMQRIMSLLVFGTGPLPAPLVELSPWIDAPSWATWMASWRASRPRSTSGS